MSESPESPPSRTVYETIVAILQTDLEEKSRIIHWFAWRAKLILEVAEKFWKDDCLTYAASLAYTTLLALAPLTAVSLSILSSFELSKESVLEFVFSRLLPNEELAAVIEQNIDTFADNAASVSLFGVIFLVIFSVWVLSTIEYSFNMIWKVGASRPLLNQFVTYWSSVTFAPILITLSLLVTAEIREMALSPAWADYSYLQGFTLKAIPYFLTGGALFLVYKLIPYTTVYTKPALIGATIAGVLFESAKGGFNFYLTNFASYEKVYGAMATIPIFLFWLYLTWLIVLLGSVIAYAIQNPKEIQSQAKDEGFEREQYRTYYTVRLLIEATRQFESGRGAIQPKEVMKKLEINSAFYEEMVRRLAALDLVEPVGGISGTFLFKKPPESIMVADLLLNLNGKAFGVSPQPMDDDRQELVKIFESVGHAVSENMYGIDLLSLANNIAERPAKRA